MRPRTAELRRRAARLADAGLVAVAAVGAVVLLARLAGAVLGLELVTFATGSMAPAFPQGSLAVVQRVPLPDVRLGDVVEVARPGALPITHRVIAVTVRGGQAVLRLRGDANRRPDPEPYVVRRLSRVVTALPAVLVPLRWAGTAQGGVLAALAGALAVGWACWPRPRAGGPAAPA